MNPKSRWALLAAYVGFIYLSIPNTRPVVTFLRERNMLRLTIAASCGLIAIGLYRLLTRKHGLGNKQSLLFLALTVIIYFWIFYFIRLPEEGLHYVEYGLLTPLAIYCLSPWLTGLRLLVAATGLGMLAGLGDEGIQYFTPGRYFEWSDVMLNVKGVLLGLTLYLLFKYLLRRSHVASTVLLLFLLNSSAHAFSPPVALLESWPTKKSIGSYWIGIQPQYSWETFNLDLSDGHRYSTQVYTPGYIEVGAGLGHRVKLAGAFSYGHGLYVNAQADLYNTDEIKVSAIGSVGSFNDLTLGVGGLASYRGVFGVLQYQVGDFDFEKIGYDDDHPTPYNHISVLEHSILPMAGYTWVMGRLGLTAAGGWRWVVVSHLQEQSRTANYQHESGPMVLVKMMVSFGEIPQEDTHE